MSFSEKLSPESNSQEVSDRPEHHIPGQASLGGVEISAPTTTVKAQGNNLSNRSPIEVNHNMSPQEINNEPGQSGSQKPEDVETDDAELPAFDEQDFQHRWMEALAAADENEQKLYREFNAYADAFQLWSGTSSQKDSERAVKRMKTKLAFIDMSEQDLAAKKQHYINVVNAFQNALNILKTSSTMPLR